MKPVCLALILILFTHLNDGYSQGHDTIKPKRQKLLHFESELGISFISQKEQNLAIYLRNLKVSPLYSPLIGISGNLNISKTFKMKMAVQYNRTGYVLPFDKIKGNQPYKIFFDKLCVPVSVDFSPITAKMNPSIILGWRPNILLSGDLLVDYSWETDLFSIDDPPNRITHQFFVGCSVTLHGNLGIKLIYSSGQTISIYARNAYFRGNWQGELKNSEFAVSLTYLFIRKV